MKPLKSEFPILLLILVTYSLTQAQNSVNSDFEKVTTAANAYIESIYDVDTTKVYKYIDRELFKKGVYYSKKNKVWSVLPMSFNGLVNTAKTFNEDRSLPKNSPKMVEVLDLQEKIANVKIEAIWGMDYLLLRKDEYGDWKITQILWQSYTPKQWANVEAKMKSKK